MSSLRSPGLQRSNTSGTDDTRNTETVGTGNSRPTTNSNQLDRSPDSPCLHSGPNSAAPKIINPAHKPANQQRRSPGAHTGNGAQVLATLRNTAINLHRLNGADNIAEACRITALTANRRLDLLNPQFPSSQAC
ncbi:hypothetical protein MPSD_32600 [Mycobacterium pseudoshottsii JCM 15466]|nr:hypothetical protein MPSD_32600 [Mycobacterium pseudoshottsii JCM 15466]